MRFLVDACTGPSVARWLRSLGHKVFSVHERARRATDEVLIEKACRGRYIIVTNDKDFGELVFRSGHPHRGVILLRLRDERVENKIAVLESLFQICPDILLDNFTVATEKTIRVVGPQTGLSDE